MFITAALDEPHHDDIICESSGFTIALKKSIGSGEASITVDHSGSGFTAEIDAGAPVNL
jgi:hypothetical protein